MSSYTEKYKALSFLGLFDREYYAFIFLSVGKNVDNLVVSGDKK